MPLEDSWNIIDSPLGKAECVLTSWQSGLLCRPQHMIISLLSIKQTDITKPILYLLLATVCRALRRKLHASWFLKARKKTPLASRTTPNHSLGDLMLHRLSDPSSFRLVHLDVDSGGDTCPVSQWCKMNASHSISHLLDEIFGPVLFALFVVQLRLPLHISTVLYQ
jgi:hypothetical protein